MEIRFAKQGFAPGRRRLCSGRGDAL